VKVDNHSGASEVVGAMILIAVIGTVVSIAGVAILSQPQQAKIPALNAEIDFVGNTVMITHNGGDTLQKDQMAIMVDGVDRTNSFVLKNGNGWSSWVIGDTLAYTGDSAPPGSIQIIYTGSSSGRLLQSWGNTSVIASSTTPVTTATVTTTTPAPPVVTADFSGTPTSGYLPLAVQFTDLSAGPINQWSWAFGDGNTSSVPSPLYTYPDAGNYTVILIVTNSSYGVTSTATKVNYTQVQSFAEYVNNESVFVYGTTLVFSGDTITGENATVVIMGPLDSTELNMNSAIAVNTIYVDGDVYLGSGSVSLGYPGKLGDSYVNGDFNVSAGNHNIYGDVSATGNANLAGANILGNLSVDGDVYLGWATALGANSQVNYTGTLSYPPWYSESSVLSKCVHQDSVPGFTIPDIPIPPAKSTGWYATEGYVNTVPLVTGMKVYSDSGYTSTVSGTASNVVVVAANGDIDLSGGGSSVSGILFAPKGKVTFNGDYFEGVVIARDGLYVTSGGTDITFKNMDEYISDSADYPF